MNTPNIPPPMPSGPQHPPKAPAPTPSKSNNKALIGVAIGCGIFFLIGMLGILAAIALPAYQDYTMRAKAAESINAAAAYKLAVTDYVTDKEPGDCQAIEDLQQAGPATLPGADLSWAGAYEDGACGFAITFNRPETQLKGKTIDFYFNPEVGEWDCTGGDLESRYRSVDCRSY
jgi:type IV pilus assembly protein PilA